MHESTFFADSDQYAPNGPAPWFGVRLTFADGARIEVLAAVSEGGITIEDSRADPSLPLDGFVAPAGTVPDLEVAVPGKRRARPSWPRGSAGRRIAAEAYLGAQGEGRDPVLAVMYATGRSRRKSLKVIAAARDDGYLTPRHNRR